MVFFSFSLSLLSKFVTRFRGDIRPCEAASKILLLTGLSAVLCADRCCGASTLLCFGFGFGCGFFGCLERKRRPGVVCRTLVKSFCDSGPSWSAGNTAC